MDATITKQFPWKRDFEIADIRWQLLKRSAQYCAAYRNFVKKHPKFPRQLVYMTPEHVTRALKDAQIFRNKWGCSPADPSLKNTNPFIEGVVDLDLIAPVFNEKEVSLRFDIPISMPSEATMRWVRYWVSFYKRKAKKEEEVTKTRLQDIKLAIKIYDLKMAGKTYGEIFGKLAEELDPEFLGTGVDRAKNLFNTAKTWIKRAEMKSLWIDAPWMFDTAIDKHRRAQPETSHSK